MHTFDYCNEDNSKCHSFKKKAGLLCTPEIEDKSNNSTFITQYFVVRLVNIVINMSISTFCSVDSALRRQAD